MKSLFVFCEGRHDIQFLRRILLATNLYRDFTRALDYFPSPLHTFARNRLHADGQIRLHTNGDVPPTLDLAMESTAGDLFVLFLNRGGVARPPRETAAIRAELRNLFESLIAPPPSRSGLTASSYGVASFIDADTGTRADAEQRLIDDFGGHFGDLTGLTHGTWTKDKLFGFFVFTAPQQNSGSLDDILLDLFNGDADHSTRSDAAGTYLDTHKGALSKLARKPAKMKKATITVAEQIAHPGSGMDIVVRDTALLGAGNLTTHATCADVIDFFSRAL